MIDFKAFAASLNGRAEELLPLWFPAGKFRGNEFLVGSLDGEEGESLSININSGRWADFARQDHRGADLLSLYAAARGIKMLEAAKELGAPDTPSAFDGRHVKHGMPSGTWAYKDSAGALIGYVCRYDTPEGKQYCPWRQVEGKWKAKAFDKPRPLFGLETIEDKAILLVEGEKSAVAARKFAGTHYHALSWCGGATAYSTADLTTLYGRPILLWPDADEPGRKAMRAVAALLAPHCPTVKLLDVADLSDGWDAADALEQGFDWPTFRAWAAPRASLVPPPAVAAAPQPAPVKHANGNHSAPPELETQLVEPPADASEPTEPDPGPPESPRIDDLPPGGVQVAPRSATPQSDRAKALYAPLPDETAQGKPINTIANLREVARRCNITIRYNLISKREEILIPNKGFSVDNQACATLATLNSICATFRMPATNLQDYVTVLADENIYNPVRAWVGSRPWDGVDRFEALCATLDVDGNEGPRQRDTFLRRWLVSAIAAAYRPQGIAAQGVLVLQGNQNIGKTQWFKRLVPEHLGLTKDGLSLKPDDKDSVKRAVSYWLVELGELDATFRKSDVSALKAFLTADMDVLRMPYARADSRFVRRTVFFASVNPREFLHDETGNRRYWTLACRKINHEHDIDMQQLWAQVLAWYEAGDTWLLTDTEADELNRGNLAHKAPNPIEERIVALQWDTDEKSWEWKTATQVLMELGIKNPTRSECTQAAIALGNRNHGWRKRSAGANLLLVPPGPAQWSQGPTEGWNS